MCKVFKTIPGIYIRLHYYYCYYCCYYYFYFPGYHIMLGRPSVSQESWQISELLMVFFFFHCCWGQSGFLGQKDPQSNQTLQAVPFLWKDNCLTAWSFRSKIKFCPSFNNNLSSAFIAILSYCAVAQSGFYIQASLLYYSRIPVSCSVTASQFLFSNSSTLFVKWDVYTQMGSWNWNFFIIRGEATIFPFHSLMALYLHLQITLAFSDWISHVSLTAVPSHKLSTFLLGCS